MCFVWSHPTQTHLHPFIKWPFPNSIMSNTIQISWHQKIRTGISPVTAFSSHNSGGWLYFLASYPVWGFSRVPATLWTSISKSQHPTATELPGFFFSLLVLWNPSSQPEPSLPAQAAQAFCQHWAISETCLPTCTVITFFRWGRKAFLSQWLCRHFHCSLISTYLLSCSRSAPCC